MGYHTLTEHTLYASVTIKQKSAKESLFLATAPTYSCNVKKNLTDILCVLLETSTDDNQLQYMSQK